MATIDLTIAGRRHELACRDGEEAHLRQIAAMVDAKATDAARSMGGMSEARQMLFAALMLADELDEARATLAEHAAAMAAQAAAPPPPPQPDPATFSLIERLAERVERLAALVDAPAAERAADGVEKPVASA